MRNIKNLMKVATIVGDDEKVLMDLYKDLGEYLGLSSSKTEECNPKMAVIGKKFDSSQEAREVLEKLGYEQVNRYNYIDIKDGLYVVIEYDAETRRYVVCENK